VRSIRCPLAQAAARWPDRPALCDDTRTITYQQYHRVVSNLAAQLRNMGVEPGAQVAILQDNRIEYPILIMALIRLGAVPCPLNRRLPEETWHRMLGLARCRHVVFDSSLSAMPAVGSIHAIDLRNLNFTDEAEAAGDHAKDLDSPATVIFTSGSSGEPKGALHTYGNHYHNALGSNENIPFGPGDCWGLTLPLYHVGGLSILFRAILGGGAVRIVPSAIEKTSRWLSGDLTHVSLVGAQLYRLLEDVSLDRTAISRLKAVLLGGSAIPDRLIQRACELGLPLVKSYGLTEMGSQVTTTALGDLPAKLHSSGKLLRHRQLTIAPDSEILVRGETLFAGYLSDGAIARPTDTEGWFHTGDLGCLDDDGYLIVTGRKDNMFVSGGENIQPEEIERALLQIDGVTSAVVVPAPHDKWGFRPVAFVEMASDTELNADSLKEQLKCVLPGYKVPDRLLPFPASDDQPQLKVSRARLMEVAQYSGRLSD
jgi:o-succinylbenzoate---CoA ligase